MAAVVTGFDAEAGWRHRRCCATPCYSSCYTPCYSSCYDSCGCASTCYTVRDACGYCSTATAWTVVSTPVVVSDCCVASAAPAPAAQAAAPAPAVAPTASTAAR